MNRDSKASMAMAYLSLLLSTAGLVLSIVSVVGVWWYGKISPKLFGGVVSGEGSLTLWNFVSSTDLLGFSLPQSVMSLDEGACGGDSLLSPHKACSQLYAIRGLTIASLVFMCFTLLSAAGALFALGDCFQGKHRVKSQLTTSFLAIVSSACMIGALAVGASSDASDMMMDLGGLGSACYCAIAQVLVGLVLSSISCWGGLCVEKPERKQTARPLPSERSEV